MVYNDEQPEAGDRRVDDPHLVCVQSGGQHLLPAIEGQPGGGDGDGGVGGGEGWW